MGKEVDLLKNVISSEQYAEMFFEQGAAGRKDIDTLLLYAQLDKLTELQPGWTESKLTYEEADKLVQLNPKHEPKHYGYAVGGVCYRHQDGRPLTLKRPTVKPGVCICTMMTATIRGERNYYCPA